MEYVSQVTLDVDGQSITDFEECSESEVELHKKVELMGKTGFCKVTPRYGVKVNYVIPSDAEEFDFNSVGNGRLTIDRQNGKRITYTGLYPLKIGETKYGKDEAKKEIEFGAEDRIEE